MHRPLLFLALLLSCAPSVDDLRAECPALTAAGRLPASAAEAAAQRAAGAVWTNREIRAQYVCAAAGIGALDALAASQGRTWEQRAHLAFEARHQARMTARAMMADPAEVAALEARDLEKYGNPHGPTFAWLEGRARDKGLQDDAIYQSIVEGAQRTDEATNRLFGLGG
jgi:hypothetical protein